MLKCPKCGHTWQDRQRASAGKARWRGLSKERRAAIARAAVQARWKRQRRAAG